MILLHPEAVAEARIARRRYAGLNPAAGLRFLAEYDEVVDRIARAPERWPLYPHVTGQYRWCRFRRFPFAAIYETFPPVAHILAIAPDRREPGYWSSRT